MLRVVLPVPVAGVDVVDVRRTIDVDVVVAPAHVAAPVAAGRPAAERNASAECKTGGESGAGVISRRRREVVGRVGRIRPLAIDHGGVVVGDVERFGLSRFDHDHLLVLLGLDRNLLLLGGLQLLRRLSPGAQPLDRIHNVRLLRQHRVAKLLRPGQFRAHHAEHRRRRDQRFDAFVPGLTIDRVFELIALQVLVLIDPAAGLDYFQRIGRSHQRLRQQVVGIKRDRREKLIELLRLQQILGRRSRCGRHGSGGCRLRLCHRRIRKPRAADQHRGEKCSLQRNHRMASRFQQDVSAPHGAASLATPPLPYCRPARPGDIVLTGGAADKHPPAIAKFHGVATPHHIVIRSSWQRSGFSGND